LNHARSKVARHVLALSPVVAGILLIGAEAAHAGSSQSAGSPRSEPFPCSGMSYAVENPPLLPGGTAALPETVELGDGTVSLSNGCAQGRVLARKIARDTFALRGAWRHCQGRAGKVGFWVRVGADCERLVGRVGTSEPRSIHVFRAGRVPTCEKSGDCAPGAYCRRSNGACTGRGACVPRPDACIAIHDPVCGCDGASYANRCAAAAAGASVAHAGACELACSTARSPGCPDGEACSRSAEACALVGW
jgi:hypothetical protein